MTPGEIIGVIGIILYIGLWWMVIHEMRNAPIEDENETEK